MRDYYCDYCKKKMGNIPERKATVTSRKKLPFSVEVTVTLCTGMDVCCNCATKAIESALSDEQLKKEMVQLIIDPPNPYV